MKDSSLMVRFLYKCAVGRFLLKMIMKFHLDRLIIRFLCSPLSKPVIYLYVKYNNIPITKNDLKSFDSFRDFFRRKKASLSIDNTSSHLISPYDGWLSAVPIDEKSCFAIKNSHYCVSDFHRTCKKLSRWYLLDFPVMCIRLPSLLLHRRRLPG